MLTIQTTIKSKLEKVWKFYTSAEHIVKWNSAFPDWHTTKSENDLKVGGKFLSRMEAKDKSAGFDFTGIYDKIRIHKLIAYTMDDGRKAGISFKEIPGGTEVTINFEAESENPEEIQRKGWQAILDNFKKYVEEND